MPEVKEGNRPPRESVKTHHSNWKDKLRQNCLRRIREERSHLLWKIRSNQRPSADKKDIVESAFRDIFSDELQKIKQSPLADCQEMLVSKNDDLLWEYDGLHAGNSIEIESEDVLIEMERLLYKELREETIRRELEVYEDDDDYLARAVFEHMQLDNNQKGEKRENKKEQKQTFSLLTSRGEKFRSPGTKVGKNDKVWCPICKQGELLEAYHLIYCTSCGLRLDLENDKVNLDFLKERLGEVHIEHLERGCKATPRFCMETVFDLTALYIQCQTCDTFEVVI